MEEERKNKKLRISRNFLNDTLCTLSSCKGKKMISRGVETILVKQEIIPIHMKIRGKK